ncbi:TonB-dependent receptor [Sphingomonas sp. GC_Shp_3]|uniref:TonB-dependent receptor n=1 Tax=Sphingomonas sp. GC_Shp_3 TaxID=2937383 RepID=UPI002269C1F8|nr:TonB-dependent receptor [Sphingomonas sp. GC_Shp_3]
MRHMLFTGAAFAALLPAAAFAQSDTPAHDHTTAHAAGAAAVPPVPRDIIVTASPFALSRDDVPTIVAKVDRQQILESGGSSIADSLATVPGISATGFAAGASRPIIRGMDAQRVRILEDGLSSSDVSDVGPDHGIPIDPLSARSIEVVRGAATLRYGSQAIGGVVNAINDRVPLSLPSRALTGELVGSYGTVANTGEGSALMDGRAGDIAVHVDGFYRHTDDYDTPLGTQQNSFFRGYGETVGASYFFGPDKASHVGAAIIQYNAQYGIPSDDTYIDMRQTKVLTKSSFELGSGAVRTLNIDGSYADYTHSEDEPDGTVVTTFRNKEFDGRAELLFGKLGFIDNSALGVEVQNRKFQAIGEDSSYLFPTETQSEAGYLFTETQLVKGLKVQASGRVEHVRVTGTPLSDQFTRVGYTPISGAIGALYDVGGAVKLGLTFSSTGRAPGITELFARGGHDGPQTFETGDPTLKIERANSIEGTLRFNSGRFRFEGSAYSTWFNNYIFGDLTGRTCDDDGVCTLGDGGELKELFYRQQGAHFRGLEGEANYTFFDTGTGKLEGRAIADYTRATLDNGGNVPRIPPYRYGGGLTWTSTAFDLGFLMLHSGRQDKFGAFDTATPGFNALNAHVSVRPFKAYPGIELAVVGQNLTNDVQRDAAALNKDLVVLPGRNIRFVLKVATL